MYVDHDSALTSSVSRSTDGILAVPGIQHLSLYVMYPITHKRCNIIYSKSLPLHDYGRQQLQCWTDPSVVTTQPDLCINLRVSAIYHNSFPTQKAHATSCIIQQLSTSARQKNNTLQNSLLVSIISLPTGDKWRCGCWICDVLKWQLWIFIKSKDCFVCTACLNANDSHCSFVLLQWSIELFFLRYVVPNKSITAKVGKVL
jgi:hypothetical protein